MPTSPVWPTCKLPQPWTLRRREAAKQETSGQIDWTSTGCIDWTDRTWTRATASGSALLAFCYGNQNALDLATARRRAVFLFGAGRLKVEREFGPPPIQYHHSPFSLFHLQARHPFQRTMCSREKRPLPSSRHGKRDSVFLFIGFAGNAARREGRVIRAPLGGRDSVGRAAPKGSDSFWSTVGLRGDRRWTCHG